MFKKILIANRGEIACRVTATAHKMGIKVVAIYSDADYASRHVKMSDEAIYIGPPPVAESYLRGDVIIAAALKSGAEAIHPGYGFLSENPEFVDAVEAAGLVFIGPSAASIRAMGLKDAAKVLMENAGVPVVPGYHGSNQDAAFLAAEAEKIGYPVLIKARAGGGGKGMRKVEGAGGFLAALESAQREGQASFGDPHVLIEKYISAPRHIEVQVFGDNHGNVVHLFERDCSLQRRHQKIIEEAPAPGMTPEMRAAMTDAAVKAARAINYSGAGTIEFIVDGSGPLTPDRFWFMEMNTRLQVEHPVTEAITGHDLVEWQLLVAAGQPLPQAQADLHIHGHAFECRLYAEDAANDFLPVTGKLEHLKFGDARIETGVVQGDRISPYYDPMIAKIVTAGATRVDALAAMRSALAATHVGGTITNIDFLSALCAHDGFANGNVDTGLIERDMSELLVEAELPEAALAVAAIGALNLDLNAAKLGWRLWGNAEQKLSLVRGAERLQRTIIVKNSRCLGVSGGTAEVWLNDVERVGDYVSARIDGKKCVAELILFKKADGTQCVSVLLDEETWQFEVPDPLSVHDTSQGDLNLVTAPMSGLVQIVKAKAGQQVKAGDQLVVIEAMKMEHSLVAPRDAIVLELSCAVGDSVEDGAVLVRFEQEDAS